MIVLTDKHKIPFQIDPEDYEAVSRYPWCIGGPGYPFSKTGKYPNDTAITLHQFLLGKAPPGLEWDHINRDKLDNRRANLRAVTRSINGRNIGLRRHNTSGVTGVYWFKPIKRWYARINVGKGRKYVHLGYHPSYEAAVAARKAAEALYW